MHIAWVNRFDAGTVTAGSELATMPVTNLQNPHVSKKWHSATSVTNTHFLVDMGSAVAVQAIAILGTNLTATALWRIRASTSDATAQSGDLLDTGQGSPLDPVSAGVDTNYGTIYTVLSSEVTARYWRIDLADAAVTQIRAGRVFMGPVWAPTRSMQLGWGVTYQDRSFRSASVGGQTFIDVRARSRELRFALGFMNEAEMYGNAFELARAAGLNADILVIPDKDGSYVSQQAVWGLVAAAEPLVHETHNVYRIRYTVEERL